MKYSFRINGEDDFTPPWMARALFARARGPKHLVIVPAASHNDTYSTGQPVIIELLTHFVGDVSPSAGAKRSVANHCP